MQQNIDYQTGATLSPEKLAWLMAHRPSRPGSALDLGCGAGLYSSWLAGNGWQVHALDVNEPPAIQGVQTRGCNLEDGLPFPDQSFDLILAWDVLEHLNNEQLIWRDIARLLRPSGILIGSVPHQADHRLHPYNLAFKHHIDKTHQREYSPEDLTSRMKAVQLIPLAVELKGPVSPQVIAEFVSFKPARRPVALWVGAMRRLGLLKFGELYADIFFAGRKESFAVTAQVHGSEVQGSTVGKT